MGLGFRGRGLKNYLYIFFFSWGGGGPYYTDSIMGPKSPILVIKAPILDDPFDGGVFDDTLMFERFCGVCLSSRGFNKWVLKGSLVLLLVWGSGVWVLLVWDVGTESRHPRRSIGANGRGCEAPLISL